MSLHALTDLPAALAWLRARVGSAGRLVIDSRAVRPGDAFIAWPGAATDGRRFVPAALAAGASACLVEAEGAEAFDFGAAPVAAIHHRRKLGPDSRELARRQMPPMDIQADDERRDALAAALVGQGRAADAGDGAGPSSMRSRCMLSQHPLQGPPMHAKLARRVADVAPALLEDALDVLPSHAIGGQGSVRNACRYALATESSEEASLINGLGQVVRSAGLQRQNGAREAVVAADDHDERGRLRRFQCLDQVKPMAIIQHQVDDGKVEVILSD